MSAARRDTTGLKTFGDWTSAEGVLPVERALADEHEAMHGEDLSAALDQISVDFDPAQFTDVPALARDLRDALNTSDFLAPGATSKRVKLDAELTPRDAVGKLLLRDAALKTALGAYESAGMTSGTPAANAFAIALTTTFNALLGQRLVDEPAFRSFVEAGAVDALGEVDPAASAADASAQFLRRANRALLEAAFPDEVALMRDRRLAVVFDAARKRDTAALCLSGGGIRSSTFALGIMQGLARHKLLGQFDYLSTVSGGGLSGGWLSAWMRRSGAPAVHEALRTPGREKLQPEPEPLQGLRAFSHWLTPSAGAMSVDSWTVIATVIRNLLLNWLVLLPLLAGLVLLPRLLLAVLALDFITPKSIQTESVSLGVAIGMLFMLGSAAYIEWVRASGDNFAKGRRGAPSQGQVLVCFLAPRVLGSTIIVLAYHIGSVWSERAHDGGLIEDRMQETAASLLLLASVLVITIALMRRGTQTPAQSIGRSTKALISGLIGYVLPMFILNQWDGALYVTLAPVVMMLGSVVANQLYTGMTSNEASDAEREWSARANAWILIVSIGWMVASGIVLFGPQLLGELWEKLTLIGVGGVSSWLTVALSKRSAQTTSGKPSTADAVSKVALSLVMPLVVACLIIALAASNNGALNAACQDQTISKKLHCSPPSFDSTSVPMLGVILESKDRDADAAEAGFAALMDADAGGIPGTDSAATDALAADSAITAASKSFTAASLSRDSVKARMILRQAWDLPPALRGVPDSSAGLLGGFRAFTAARDKHILEAGEDTTGHMLAWVESALATDTTLKGDFEKRDASLLSLRRLDDSVRKANAHFDPAARALWFGVLALMILMIGTGVIFSMFVNTNTFSLHAMWKARTVRAFLGTTRASSARNPNPFTGFDADDDLSMRDLWPARASAAEAANATERSEVVPPMHVLNVTLNLAAGRDLAWQQRKGESMTLTPLHGGSMFTGYRRMEPHADPAVQNPSSAPGYGGPDGVSLGTAMAISGAAASPNDGSGTTALGAFLMTFFNARLGWWLGNPGAPGAATYTRPAPKWRLTPILSEMFGQTSDRSEYVYLSDGGHFENLALYEMVFRRNRFIVVSDAGADPDYTFEDLGNAVRKIRIDFGIPIEFDNPVNIGRAGTADSAYWATAKIRYSAVDMPDEIGCRAEDCDGVLVYIKPAVYGKVEPRDVVNYANLSPTFPQESSADQFFSESQFESYRALGSWIIDQLVANSAAPGNPATVNALRSGSLLSEWPSLKPFQSKY